MVWNSDLLTHQKLLSTKMVQVQIFRDAKWVKRTKGGKGHYLQIHRSIASVLETWGSEPFGSPLPLTF